MALNVELLRSSLALVAERQPEITPRFYEILFERYPEAEKLFGLRSRDAQAKMLQDAIVAVIDHLEDASWLQEQLGALGAKHVDYGVTEPMYAWVGESLLATLAEIAGDDWNDELQQAWTDAYGAIRDLMLAGAAAAAAE